MSAVCEPAISPAPVIGNETRNKDILAPRFNVICWNDPVNLMSFVVHVFRRIFGWDRTRAEKHMMEVHEKGKSLLVQTDAEMAEHYVHQLQSYKLQATMEKSE